MYLWNLCHIYDLFVHLLNDDFYLFWVFVGMPFANFPVKRVIT